MIHSLARSDPLRVTIHHIICRQLLDRCGAQPIRHFKVPYQKVPIETKVGTYETKVAPIVLGSTTGLSFYCPKKASGERVGKTTLGKVRRAARSAPAPLRSGHAAWL
jgi:hypothetical protein